MEVTVYRQRSVKSLWIAWSQILPRNLLNIRCCRSTCIGIYSEDQMVSRPFYLHYRNPIPHKRHVIMKHVHDIGVISHSTHDQGIRNVTRHYRWKQLFSNSTWDNICSELAQTCDTVWQMGITAMMFTIKMLKVIFHCPNPIIISVLLFSAFLVRERLL